MFKLLDWKAMFLATIQLFETFYLTFTVTLVIYIQLHYNYIAQLFIVVYFLCSLVFSMNCITPEVSVVASLSPALESLFLSFLLNSEIAAPSIIITGNYVRDQGLVASEIKVW